MDIEKQQIDSVELPTPVSIKNVGSPLKRNRIQMSTEEIGCKNEVLHSKINEIKPHRFEADDLLM